MVHAVSASYLRSEHMSPPAAGMALALHVTVALALWWVSPLKFIDVEPQQPIEVTMEAPVPKPPEPPQVEPPAAPPAAPSPAAPASRPPPPPSGSAQGALGLPPLPTGTAGQLPAEPPKVEPPTTVEPQQALASPKIDARPAPEPVPPPVDKVLPPVEAPPAPLTMQDFVKIAPPPLPREVVKPLPQQVAPAPPQQALKPSPLSSAPQQASRDSGSSPNTFVNPADTYVYTQIADNYLSQVARKISQYRYYPHTPVVRTVEGVVVARLVIARDGRLLDVSVVRSSGYQSLDTGLMDTIRKASPFPPLPGDLKGDKASFTLNIPYRLNPE